MEGAGRGGRAQNYISHDFKKNSKFEEFIAFHLALYGMKMLERDCIFTYPFLPTH